MEASGSRPPFDCASLQYQHAVIVRVRGKDSAEKRAIGRPVAIKLNGYTTISSSGILLASSKGGAPFIITPASIFSPFMETDGFDSLQSALAITDNSSDWRRCRVVKVFAVKQYQAQIENLKRWSGWHLGFGDGGAASNLNWRLADWIALLQIDTSSASSSSSSASASASSSASSAQQEIKALSASSIRRSQSLKKGEELTVISSPYALFAPYAFFNSITKATVGNVVFTPPPSSATPLSDLSNSSTSSSSSDSSTSSTKLAPSLILIDASILPGSEGAPLYDSNGKLVSMVMPPLKKRWGGGEVHLALPLDLLAGYIPDLGIPVGTPPSQNGNSVHHRSSSSSLVPNNVSGDAMEEMKGGVEYGKVEAACDSLVCVRVESHWASGIVLSPDYVITNAHLISSFLSDPNKTGRISILQPIQVLIPHERWHKVPEEMRRGTATIGEESSVPVGEQGMTLEEMITHEHWISYQAEIEYKSNNVDFLLLRVRPSLHPALFRPLHLGSPTLRCLPAGERIFVLGYPSFPPATGVGPTATAGVVSKVIPVRDHAACILTSATVAAGNSGGMLVDQHGALLGMVTNNLREKSGALIFKLNFSLPVTSLSSVFKYVQGKADYAVLAELEKEDEEVSRIWRLQVSQPPPPRQVSQFLNLTNLLDSNRLPRTAKL